MIRYNFKTGLTCFLSVNVVNIYNIFKRKNYVPKGYNIFLIREPKYRIVMSQGICDKVINHVVGRLLIEALEPSLINTNVATRKGRGTHYGIRYLKRYLNELKGHEIYALKFDISKYFYSINHEILKREIKKKIKDKDFLKILFTIIDSTDCGVNERINYLKDREIDLVRGKNFKDKIIEEVKRIPIYKRGYGLPIGNLSSQIMAIFYLNYLDHFIKEVLKVRYIRYMDDGVLICFNKEYLRYCLGEIKRIVGMYDLRLNDKTKIINVSKEGIDFLGFHFYVLNNRVIMKVRGYSKKRYKRVLNLVRKGMDEKNVLPSYRDHFKWGNCYNLLNGFRIR